MAKNGITCNPNIPTEEVFTTPHALKVEGHVSSTKPLSHQGTLIDDIQVTFEGGRIIEAKASKGEEVLNRVLDTARSEEHTSELQSLMRISYAVFCLNKKQPTYHPQYAYPSYTSP